MAILHNVLRQQLANSFIGKRPGEIADIVIHALNEQTKRIIKDFEKGKSIEEIKKIWLTEEDKR